MGAFSLIVVINLLNRTMSHKLSNDYITERENNRIADGLSSKVSQLKNIAIDMRDEARMHNSFLSNLSDDFADSDSLLGRTSKKFKTAVNSGSQNRTIMCYIVLASVFLFLLFYYGSSALSIIRPSRKYSNEVANFNGNSNGVLYGFLGAAKCFLSV